MTATALKASLPIGEGASVSPPVDILAGIRGAKWAPPFVMIDRIIHMSSDTAVALVEFNGDAERFAYGSHASPSLLIEGMAQLSLALIRHGDPTVEIGIIPSLREITMNPPPAGRFSATIHVRWVEGAFPRYGFAGTALVDGHPVCEAMLDILARREEAAG
ncbi:MAG TPA: hypothetical protein VNS02_08315 [Rhizobiaceae bacterium]|nr:hypothetical protein [Rhizobiaceae bacterium]